MAKIMNPHMTPDAGSLECRLKGALRILDRYPVVPHKHALSKNSCFDLVLPERERRVAVRGFDLEELLVAWLQELLYLWTVEEFVARTFLVKIVPSGPQEAEEGWRLEGVVAGEAWDEARHEVYTDIKAVTYHNLHIRKETSRGGKTLYRVDVVLDV